MIHTIFSLTQVSVPRIRLWLSGPSWCGLETLTWCLPFDGWRLQSTVRFVAYWALLGMLWASLSIISHLCNYAIRVAWPSGWAKKGELLRRLQSIAMLPALTLSRQHSASHLLLVPMDAASLRATLLYWQRCPPPQSGLIHQLPSTHNCAVVS